MSPLAFISEARVWIETALVATLLGGAPALLFALWTTELAPRALSRPLRRITQAAAALPSFVWGHVALVALSPSRAVALSVALAPSLTLFATRALRETPSALREASLSLGATRVQTIARAVLPAARGALAAGVVRAFGRVLVEGAALVWILSRVELGARSASNDEGLLRALAPIAAWLRAVTRDAHPTVSSVAVIGAIAAIALASSSLARRLGETR